MDNIRNNHERRRWTRAAAATSAERLDAERINRTMAERARIGSDRTQFPHTQSCRRRRTKQKQQNARILHKEETQKKRRWSCALVEFMTLIIWSPKTVEFLADATARIFWAGVGRRSATAVRAMYNRRLRWVVTSIKYANSCARWNAGGFAYYVYMSIIPACTIYKSPHTHRDTDGILHAHTHTNTQHKKAYTFKHFGIQFIWPRASSGKCLLVCVFMCVCEGQMRAPARSRDHEIVSSDARRTTCTFLHAMCISYVRELTVCVHFFFVSCVCMRHQRPPPDIVSRIQLVFSYTLSRYVSGFVLCLASSSEGFRLMRLASLKNQWVIFGVHRNLHNSQCAISIMFGPQKQMQNSFNR